MDSFKSRKKKKAPRIYRILNIVINILLIISAILSITSMIIKHNIFPTLITTLFNQIKLNLRINDVEFAVDLKEKKIKKKKGGLYE